MREWQLLNTTRILRPLRDVGIILIVLARAASAVAQSAPPLPPPSGPVVSVSTVSQLQSAVASLTSGTTILIEPGTYQLTETLWIRNGVTNVALRGATGHRDDVVILGTGMRTPGVNIAIKVSNAQDVLIANLSVGEVYWHPIQLQGEQSADRVHIYNVRLFDAGQQFVKGTIDFSAPDGVDDSIVEYSLIEYTTIGPDDGYTDGIDILHGANWTIRYNVFRNMRVPPTATYRGAPAILMWKGSRNTLVHSNTFINCERAIVLGLELDTQNVHSHEGGMIYNNFIYRNDATNADSGVSVWDSPGTLVYHNTVIQNGTYPIAIEFRFSTTIGVEVINNLTDAAIVARDGAQGVVSSNYTTATAGFFVNAAAADLHLTTTAAPAIDTGTYLRQITTDWDGNPRPAGLAPDLGADELYAPPANQPPTAVAAASATSGTAPFSVTFDGNASSDPEGQSLTFQWAFGDGQSALGAKVSHMYQTAGSYTAVLTVTDQAGSSSTASVRISVTIPLAAPTDLQAIVASTSVVLTWRDQATGETEYLVERSSGRKDPFVVIAHLPAGSTTYTDAAVSRGSYTYRVRAANASTGEVSASSNMAMANVKLK